MSEPEEPASLVSLTFTDRTRYVRGTQDCATARYIEFHSGPTGYGIREHAQHVPLGTGVRIHRMIAAVLGLFQDTPAPGSVGAAEELIQEKLPAIHEVLAEELDAYFRYCARKAGFVGDGVGRPEEVLGAEAQHTMLEQASLMAGLVLGWVRVRLPGVLHQFEILSVEQEEEYVVGCDCGLTDGFGDFGDHGARGCKGIGQTSKPDVLFRRRLDRRVVNYDWKSAAYCDGPWLKQWQDNIQMTIGTAGAERRLGERIQEYYVGGMVKGQRKRGWTGPNEYNGPKRQQSSFCYVEVRQANPPLQTLSFHTSGKWHEKQPTWEAPFPTGAPKPATMGEHIVAQLAWWTGAMRLDDLQELYVDVGPYLHQPKLLERYLEGMQVEERTWQRRLWALWEAQEESGESAYALMTRFVPPSWQCHKWKRDCGFIPICFQWAGWEDPLSMETDSGAKRYELRAPHHEAERLQAKQRGIDLPLDEEEEEED